MSLTTNQRKAQYGKVCSPVVWTVSGFTSEENTRGSKWSLSLSCPVNPGAPENDVKLAIDCVEWMETDTPESFADKLEDALNKIRGLISGTDERI